MDVATDAGANRAWRHRSSRILLVAAALLLVTLTPTAHAGTSTPPLPGPRVGGGHGRPAPFAAPAPQDDQDWLSTINYWRAAAGLASVSDQPAWDLGIQHHLTYLEDTPASYETGQYASAHTENPASPYYTSDGALEAGVSDLDLGGASSPAQAIDDWLTAPFHAIGMLRAQLSQVAFADEPTGGYAGLDVIQGIDYNLPAATSPILYPGPGSTTKLLAINQGELPDPRETCGWQDDETGLPLIVMLPQAPANGLTASLSGPAGTESTSTGDLCVVDENTYYSSDPTYGSTGLAILQDDHAVLLIPRNPLQTGSYSVSVQQPGASDIDWSFNASAPPTDIALNVSPTSVAADGLSQATAAATVTDAEGNGVPGETIDFSSTDPNETIGTVTDQGNGTYTAQITSSTSIGSATITADDAAAGLDTTATLQQTAGPGAQVEVSLSPATLVADGQSTATATATVTDSAGHPVTGDQVSFAASDPDVDIGAVTDHGDGTYSAQITSSTTLGQVTITGTDMTPLMPVSGTATLSQTAGPAAGVTVALGDDSIPADGSSHTKVTATVTDAVGHPLTGETVELSSSDGGETIGPVTDNGDGTYTAELTSSTTAGAATITATDTGTDVSGTATLTQTPGPAAHLAIALVKPTIPVHGATTVTATVNDANENPVAGETVGFTASDAGVSFGPVADAGDGTYTATVTGSGTVHAVTITATDSSASPELSDHTSLTQTAAQAATVAVSLSPASVVADGTATSTATATVSDAQGDALSGEHVTFGSSDSGDSIGPVTDHGDGTYTAAVTSGTGAESAVITATDSSVSPALHGTATLTETPGPASALGLTLSPSSVPADGQSQVTVSATITDAHGNPKPGEHPTVSTSDPGVSVGPVSDNGDGTYSAQLTASRTAHTVQVSVADGSLSGSTSFTQTAVAASSSVTLAVSPSSPVTNQSVTLTATVASGDSGLQGAVAFLLGGQPISGCGASVTSSDPVAVCHTALLASQSPATVTAAFSPSPGSDVAGSTSAPSVVQIGKASTSLSLGTSATSGSTGGILTIDAQVASGTSGAAAPTGTVAFTENGSAIAGCAQQPLSASGAASCTVSFSGSLDATVGASYTGDANFTGSGDGTPVSLQTPGNGGGGGGGGNQRTPPPAPAKMTIAKLVVRGNRINVTISNPSHAALQCALTPRLSRVYGRDRYRKCSAQFSYVGVSPGPWRFRVKAGTLVRTRFLTVRGR